MLNRFIKIGVILVLASVLISISGCHSVQLIKHPIARNSRIGIISNFRSTALFQRAGTTTSDNVSFPRRIPGLNMNALVTATVANDLYRSRWFHVIPIYHPPADDLMMLKVVKHKRLSPSFRNFVSRLIRGKKLNIVILITPGNIDFGNGQYFGNIWWANGYGVFNRTFIFMQTNIIFAAYNVFVIDAKTYNVLAKASGNLRYRTHGFDIAWHKGYAGVLPGTLKTINKMFRKKLPPSLTHVVAQIGLP